MVARLGTAKPILTRSSSFISVNQNEFEPALLDMGMMKRVTHQLINIDLFQPELNFFLRLWTGLEFELLGIIKNPE